MFEFAIRASVSSFKDASYSLRKYLQSHAIESVLLGVSGGADSVLALHLLAVAASKLPGFRLYAAHVNFHLRGDESMRDEEFVRSLAMLYPDVTFFFKDCDTTSFARKNGVSIEMAARDLRHNWWRQLQAQYNMIYRHRT
ncbi:MAG: hypothetical protein K2K29_06760 [Muribaculaceae bacterium]|nr:hypothetical protein [Muribaculaceae bacterium]